VRSNGDHSTIAKKVQIDLKAAPWLEWVTERRNVREDYRMVFGEEPENPSVIALSIDTNDTKSSSETFLGPLRFRKNGER